MNKIYTLTCNPYGKIPQKSDYHSVQGESKTYRFERIGGNIKTRDFHLKAEIHDNILELRWKL